MRLTKVTITGPDDGSQYDTLKDLTVKYPFVEWGILFSATRKGTPRYPSLGWIAGLIDYFTGPDYERVHRNFSAHVCGRLCTETFESLAKPFYQPDFLGGHPLKSIFSRIQLNGYPDHLYDTKNIVGMANSVADDFAIILPIPDYKTRDKTREYWPSNVHFLHDGSRGRGVEPTGWPVPYFGNYVGYAGGLALDNIRKHLDLLTTWEGYSNNIWIDLESGARTQECFDPDKVDSILDIARNYIDA